VPSPFSQDTLPATRRNAPVYGRERAACEHLGESFRDAKAEGAIPLRVVVGRCRHGDPARGSFLPCPLGAVGPFETTRNARAHPAPCPDRCAQIQVSELAADLEVRHLTLAQDAWEIQRLPVAASLYLFSSLLRRRLAELGYAFVFSNTGISGK
jgi:hypothetical protein